MTIGVIARLVLIFSVPDFLQQECLLLLAARAITFTYRVGTRAEPSRGEGGSPLTAHLQLISGAAA
jgi:hypothetical protein